MNEKKPVLHTESEEKSTLQMHRTKLGKKAAFKVQQTIKFRIEEVGLVLRSLYCRSLFKPYQGFLSVRGADEVHRAGRKGALERGRLT
jgi:hypothetical protein